METLSLIALVWLAALFLYTGSQKFAHYRQAVLIVPRYGILPGSTATLVGIILPWTEIGVVILLFGSTGMIRTGAGMVILLGSAFSASATVVLLKRAQRPPCGCTGATDKPVGRVTVARGLVIAGASCLVLIWPTHTPVLLQVPLALLALAPAAAGMLQATLRLRRTRQATRRGVMAQRVLEELLATGARRAG